jgi:hypothetical protein
MSTALLNLNRRAGSSAFETVPAVDTGRLVPHARRGLGRGPRCPMSDRLVRVDRVRDRRRDPRLDRFRIDAATAQLDAGQLGPRIATVGRLYVGQPRVELSGAQLTRPLGAVVLAGALVRSAIASHR